MALTAKGDRPRGLKFALKFSPEKMPGECTFSHEKMPDHVTKVALGAPD